METKRIMGSYTCLSCGTKTGIPEHHSICIGAAPQWEIYKCGSGAHPRHCDLHPHRFEEYWEEINRENDAAWDRAEKTDALKGEIRELRELLSWVKQTIHQAYHNDEIDRCKRDICAATREILANRAM